MLNRLYGSITQTTKAERGGSALRVGKSASIALRISGFAVIAGHQ